MSRLAHMGRMQNEMGAEIGRGGLGPLGGGFRFGLGKGNWGKKKPTSGLGSKEIHRFGFMCWRDGTNATLLMRTSVLVAAPSGVEGSTKGRGGRGDHPHLGRGLRQEGWGHRVGLGRREAGGGAAAWGGVGRGEGLKEMVWRKNHAQKK